MTMIHFRRLHIKKISALEFSSSSSTYSSTSSFYKPGSTKQLDSVCPTEVQESTPYSGQQGHDVEKKDVPHGNSRSNYKKHDKSVSSSKTIHNYRPEVRKTVKFEKTAKVKRVRPRHEYSQEELDLLWYNENDYLDIKKRAVETVKKMIKCKRSGGFVENEDFTARGLECRLKETAIERKEFKAYARNLVLEEQEDQNDRGIKSTTRISKIYLKASIVSSKKAQDLGQKDAEAVGDIRLHQLLS